MKKSFVVVVLLLIVFTVATCSFSKMGEVGKLPGEEKLGGKTPKTLYAEAIDYIKGLTNYEIAFDGNYTYTYYETTETNDKGETKESQKPIVQKENTSMVYKGADKTFSYIYKSEGYEERLIYDGTSVYQLLNTVKEQKKCTYDAFVSEYGNFVESGILIDLKDSHFDKVRFVPDGEYFVLDFEITADEYYELAGGDVTSSVDYKVYFDADGTIVKFERSMEYYYYESVLVNDTMTASFKNIGKTAKITAPDDADKYAIRPLASEIDTSSVKNLDGFKETDQVTEYALFTFKIEPNVAQKETESETDAETDKATDTKDETDVETEETVVEPYEGKVLVRLYPDVAPGTVANFQNLFGTATYKGLVVNGILQDFAIQIGEPISDEEEEEEKENVFEYIFGEFANNGFTNNLSHKRGVISMLRGEDPNSATYDFFICTKDTPELDGYYASFGCVIYGFETLDKIAELETDENDVPKATVTITDTRFLAKK